MWLKACVRCQGDLYLRDSEDGKEITCMQCGFIGSPAFARELLLARRRTGARTQVQAPQVLKKAA